MQKQKNHQIINKIVDEMILEIERLSQEKGSLASNIKLIKEITMVLKELEKLYEENRNDTNTEAKRNEFLDKLLEHSIIPNKKKQK